jgi:hypothetical protein
MRLAVVLLLLGCATNKDILQASALQPHPRTQTATPERLVRSEPLFVYEPTGMRHVRVKSSAQFAVVSRDRLRFHVGLADIRTPRTQRLTTEDATVWLEDERGRRYEPVREAAYAESMVHPQWRMPRDPRCAYRCARHYHDIWFRYGHADYVFTSPELLSPEREKLVLNVRRPGVLNPLRFVWTFGDGTWVRHHYATRADADDGSFLSLPRADTMVRRSDAEGETFKYLDGR